MTKKDTLPPQSQRPADTRGAAEGREPKELPASLDPKASALVGGVLVYLVFSHSWSFFTPSAPSYQHGLKSFLVSMKFSGTAALWLLVLRRLRGAEDSRADLKPAESAVSLRAQAQY